MAASEPYPTQANLANRLARLEERLDKLERGAPKTLTTFYSSSSNDILMRAGTDPDTDSRVFAVGRDSGQAAIEVRAPNEGTTQNVKIYDRRGNEIMGDSETFDAGLRRPSISHNIIRVGSTPPAQTTFVYTTVGEAYFRKSNPSVEVILDYWSSDGATNIDLRFREIDTFTTLGTLSAPYNPTLLAPIPRTRLLTPSLVIPESRFPVGGQVHLIVEAQKSVGAPGGSNFTVDVLAIRGSDDI